MSALNDEGDEVFSEQLSDLEAPGSEDGRSGGMLFKVIPVESDAVSEVAIECEPTALSEQARWIPTGEPRFEVHGSEVTDKLTVIVSSRLVWAAEERPSRWDSCSAVLYDDKGRVLGHGSGSARASNADSKERPLAGGFGTAIQVDERPDGAEIKC
ncbi:MAG TPA: hypothetical protein VEV82_00805 [Actinomycetota bacterium]|nr:hypothetical protein [Actinomycetota bacterium]